MIRPLLQRLGFAVGLLTAPALLLTHCEQSSPTTATQHVAGIELATSTGPIAGIGLGIKVGGVLQLFAQGKDATGAPIPAATISWASNAPSVATVTQQGLVKGITPGNATITAASGTITASLSLAVLDTTTAPPPPPTGTDTLLRADFSNGAPGWYPAAGTWSVSNGVYQNTANASTSGGGINTGDNFSWAGSSAWTDYSVSAKVRPMSWSGSFGLARVMGRWQSVSAWYYTLITSDGHVQLRKYVAGVATDLAPPVAYPVTLGTQYTLRLSMVGTSIRAYVNNVLLLSATDATFSSGAVALGGWNDLAQFDDVVVLNLSGTTPPPPPVTVVGSVSVAPATAGVQVGSTQQLTATVKDTGGITLSGQAVAWSSLHPSWATVSSSGLVTGVAAGVDTVTATSSGKTGRSIVTVSGIAPPPPTSGSVVLIGAGDITGSTTEGEPTAKLLDAAVAAGGSVTVFTAGDNAYQSGTSSEYANYYNPTWGRQKARTKPSPGNHDFNTSGAAGYFGYFGSVAGPGYYSYNIGAWHVISLNSNVSQSTSSSQGTWLANDLKNATQRCIVAYWHHPRFSSGSNHGSDTGMDPFWRALYAAGATLVLNGHDHEFERFAPQNPSGGSDPTKGIREFVVGTGGASLYSFGSALPNSEVRNASTHGVLKLTLSDSTYGWEFIPVAGSSFTDKGTGKCVPRGSVAVTPPPPASGSCATWSGSTITLTGLSTTGYQNTNMAPGTRIDATAARWLLNQPSTWNRMDGGSGACWMGGQIMGTISPATPYDDASNGYHLMYGLIADAGTARVENANIFTGGDGIALDTQAADNWIVRGTHIRYARDDAIENDFLNNGLIDDVLVEGAYTFISSRTYTGSPDGSNKTVTVQNSLAWLEGMDANYYGESRPGSGGMWKWVGSGWPNTSNGPSLVLNNNVFRADAAPVEGEGSGEYFAPPKLKSCSNNVMVWLGSGSLPRALPSCFTIMTGQAGLDFWNQRVAQWKAAHPAGADFTPPIVALFRIPSTLSGTVVLTATAVDDQTLTGVTFALNGSAIGTLAADYTDHALLSWDSRGKSNGSYALTATARDAAGHATTSVSVPVTVSN